MIYPVQSTFYTYRISGKLLKIWHTWSVGLQLLSFALFTGLLSLIAMYGSISLSATCALLFLISMIDAYDRIIPDVLVILLFFALACFKYPLLWQGFIFLGVGILAQTLYLILFQKPLMGWGDIKLLCCLNCFLSLDQLPIFFMVSGGLLLIALIVSRKEAFPFAPIISISFLSALIF
jgi:Flp pilus assembly protein protease CpaA